MDSTAFGSQPNIANNPSPSPGPTNTKQPSGTKLVKAQSFKHQKSEGLSTPKFLRKFNFRSKSSGKKQPVSECIPENRIAPDVNRNSSIVNSPNANSTNTNSPSANSMNTNSPNANSRIATRAARNLSPYFKANDRDVTSGILDWRGGRLVNEFWGVSLDVPANAIPEGVRQEIYFVITDPRSCENAPPLDLENGISSLCLPFTLLHVSFSVWFHQCTYNPE